MQKAFVSAATRLFRKKNQKAQAEASEEHKPKRTYLIPFISLTGLATPNLLVLAYVKPTAGFSAIVSTGILGLVGALIGFVLVLASLSGLMYLVRARGVFGRLFVVLVLIGLWGGFMYVMHDTEAGGSSTVDISNTL
jgi:hypothetical protein